MNLVWRGLTPRRLSRRWFPQLFGLGRRAGSVNPRPPGPGVLDYLFWGVIDWHYRWQRPQHLARELARMGRRVFYISANFADSSRCGFRVDPLDKEGRLFQIYLHARDTPAIYYKPAEGALRDQLICGMTQILDWGAIKGPVCLVQHPFWAELACLAAPSRLVYDRMDLHAGFQQDKESFSSAMVAAEQSLMREADLTVSSSAWLDQDSQPFTGRRLVLRNAVDYHHFSQRPMEVYLDPAGRRVIGYFGAVADWLDLELVSAIARRFQDCLVMLIGYDQCGARQYLAGLSNIQMLGEVPYERLPYYLHAFTLCILPFRRLPLTLATNPVKLYEYLSAGKPVVAVDLPEMQAFANVVRVARDGDEFLARVAEILGQEDRVESAALRRAFAAGQTWTHRAEILCQRVEDLRPRVVTSSLSAR